MINTRMNRIREILSGLKDIEFSLWPRYHGLIRRKRGVVSKYTKRPIEPKPTLTCAMKRIHDAADSFVSRMNFLSLH